LSQASAADWQKFGKREPDFVSVFHPDITRNKERYLLINVGRFDIISIIRKDDFDIREIQVFLKIINYMLKTKGYNVFQDKLEDVK
jgi:hypothetical protein